MRGGRMRGAIRRVMTPGLAGQLARASMAVVVLSVLIVGSAMIWIAYRGEQSSSQRLLFEHGEKLALLISTYVEKVRGSLAMVGALVDPSVDGGGTRDSLERALSYPGSPFTRLALVDETGAERTKVSRFHTYLPGELETRGGDPALEAALAGREYLGPAQVAGDSGLQSLVLARPARGPDFEGALVAEVEMSRLWTEISRIEIGLSGHAFLIDEKGRFLAYQRPSEVLRRYGEVLQHMPPVAEHVSGEDSQRAPRVFEYDGLTGDRVVGLERHVPGTEWAVVVEIPVSEAFANTRRMQWLWLVFGFLGVAAAGLVGLTVSRRILRPIRALTLATERIAAGDLRAPLAAGEERGDEVGALARAFERMQTELRSLYTRLELRVEELVSAKEALATSEERYRAIFENSGTALAIVDSNTVIKMVNRELEVLMGAPKEEIEGILSFKDYVAEADVELVMRYHALRRAEPDAAPKTYEIHVRTARGEQKTVVTTVALLPGGNESLVALLDVTEQRRNEEARSLLQEQLRQAQKMESIGRLAGGVAHDFNNLLTAIYGNLDLAMLDMVGSDPRSAYIEEVRRAADSAARLTGQLLAFSRKQIVEPREIDLNDLVGSFSKMLARLLGEDVRLEFVPASAPCLIKVDPSQIEQIVINLAVNARDAMPDGGRLTIELANAELDEASCARHPRLAPGPHVVLSVEDTGCGMSPEVQAKIFEPFFTTKELGRGTGLGLATVLGAVEQNAGSIEVRSAPGAGARFALFFPRIVGDEPMATRDEVERAPRGSETVLLVEDSAPIRTSTSHLLTHLGYRVVAAASAEEALSASERMSERIDILMTDVVLPGLDGHALAERLAATRPGMAVLFTSGYTDNPRVTEGISLQRLHFLAKPYTAQSLAKMIRVALAGPR